MTTLLSHVLTLGKRRTCDARCYNAKGPNCNCCCGGINHGKGIQKAAQNIEKYGKELSSQGLHFDLEDIERHASQQNLLDYLKLKE